MSKQEKYTPIEVVKEIVDVLKPKLAADIEEMKKAEGSAKPVSSWLGGTRTSAQSDGVKQTIPSGGTKQTTPSSQTTPGTKKPSIAEQINFGGKFKKEEMGIHKDKSVDHYVKMIISKEYQVQDVMKLVPKDKRDDVLAAIREKAGKKTYKGGLKKYQMEKKAPSGVDPEAHERCVREVKQDVKPRGKDQTKIGAAHAICTSSLKGKK